MFKRNRKKRSSSDVINIDSASYAMEQYKTISANIEFLEIDDNYKTILVTSHEAGVGKTTTSFHLAKAFAMKGEKVLLIGADLRKPMMNNYLTNEQKKSEGLVSAILKKAELEDCIVRSNELENLYFIYAGFIPPNPAELLQSKAMKELMDQLKENFDRIIIDSPPILPVVDARILSRYSDGMVLVVRANYSDKLAVKKAVSDIKNMRIKLLGTVFNAVQNGKDGHYYYYY